MGPAGNELEEGYLDRALTTVLSEFTALKNEVNNRTTAQGNLATISITITGLALGIGLTRVSPVILVVPLISACLGLLWIDHAVQIDKIGSYIQRDLHAEIVIITKRTTLLNWEAKAAETKNERAPRYGRLDFAVLVNFLAPGLGTLLLVLYLLQHGEIKSNLLLWACFCLATLVQALFAWLWIRTMIPRRRHDDAHAEKQ
jgi:hypothetical protein